MMKMKKKIVGLLLKGIKTLRTRRKGIGINPNVMKLKLLILVEPLMMMNIILQLLILVNIEGLK